MQIGALEKEGWTVEGDRCDWSADCARDGQSETHAIVSASVSCWRGPQVEGGGGKRGPGERQ